MSLRVGFRISGVYVQWRISIFRNYIGYTAENYINQVDKINSTEEKLNPM